MKGLLYLCVGFFIIQIVGFASVGLYLYTKKQNPDVTELDQCKERLSDKSAKILRLEGYMDKRSGP